MWYVFPLGQIQIDIQFMFGFFLCHHRHAFLSVIGFVISSDVFLFRFLSWKNQLENGKLNRISVDLTKIRSRFLCVSYSTADDYKTFVVCNLNQYQVDTLNIPCMISVSILCIALLLGSRIFRRMMLRRGSVRRKKQK